MKTAHAPDANEHVFVVPMCAVEGADLFCAVRATGAWLLKYGLLVASE